MAAPTMPGWTDADLSLGQIVVAGLSPDGATGYNAWQLMETDDTVYGLDRYYERLFTGEERAASRTSGREIDVRLRAAPIGGWLEFATGSEGIDHRYRVGVQPSGQDPWVGGYVFPGGMDGQHHLVSLRRPPGALQLDAELYCDGVLLGPFTPLPSTGGAVDGGIRWGMPQATAQGAVNWNEVRITIGEPVAGTPYCFGDGTATPCPRGNSAAAPAGCANTSGAGAQLFANGSERVTADDLVFTCASLLPSRPSLLFVGTNAVNGGDGIAFGDGLRCAGMNVQRLGVRLPDVAGSASWGPGIGGQVGALPGSRLRFQTRYRDPAGGGACGAGFNLSNGVELDFLP